MKSNLEERVLVNFRVNGNPLGYEVKLGSNASYRGIFSHTKEGKALDRALRVESNPPAGDDKSSSTKLHDSCTTGTIQATFYEAICDVGKQPTRKRTTCRTRRKRSDKISVVAPDKVLVGVPVAVSRGDYVESRPNQSNNDGPKKKYLKGAVLSRVEVKYSDTLEIKDTDTKYLGRSQSVPPKQCAEGQLHRLSPLL
jgi:hypothetical protein